MLRKLPHCSLPSPDLALPSAGITLLPAAPAVVDSQPAGGACRIDSTHLTAGFDRASSWRSCNTAIERLHARAGSESEIFMAAAAAASASAGAGGASPAATSAAAGRWSPRPGVYTAIVTPFTPDGRAVDWAAYHALLAAQVAGGVAGVVPVGTTGESPTLSAEEKHRLIADAIAHCKPKGVLVIAGTGSNDTAEAVEATHAAMKAGADAALLVSPYYNRPSQAGLIAHVAAVGAVGLPIILYNIPGRTGVLMTPATVAEVYRAIPAVAAIKEAAGSLDQVSEIAALCDIPILSGDDSLTVPMMAVGAVGVVSVLSNVVPAEIVAMVAEALAGDYRAARARHIALFPLCKAMFVETNPVPVKRAMALRGLIPSATVRLPLVGLAAESDAKLRAALAAAAAAGIALLGSSA